MGCSSDDPATPPPSGGNEADGGTDHDAHTEDDASTDPDGSTDDPDGSTDDPDGGDGGGSFEETVLTEGYVPRSLAVGGGWVYFTENNSIRRLPVAGGDVVSAFQIQENGVAARRVAANADAFVWTEWDLNSSVKGAVRSCPHSGCNDTPSSFPNDESTQEVALGDDVVAWTSHSTNSVQGNSNDTKWRVQIAAPSIPGAVAVDGTEVFYGSARQVGVGTNALFSCDASDGSCTSTQIADLDGAPLSIAVADNVVLVLTDAGLYRFDRGGQNKTKLVDNSVKLNAAVVTDGTNVYWGAAGNLFACQIATCIPTTIGTVQGHQTRGLALDDDYVYWATSDATEQLGSIRRYTR